MATYEPLRIWLPCLIALLLAAPSAADEVIITEIMYDPASDEQWTAQTEWVEIYNRSDEAVSIEGWYLANERGQTRPIHDAVTLAPGEAAVLIPGQQAVDDFRAAWGEDYPVLPVDGWHQPGLHQLTNAPSEEAGVLTLRRPAGDLADEVNYRNTGRWPTNKPDGSSIYLQPHALNATANDDGANWRRAELRRHGARHAEPAGGYNPRDLGSPGVVVGRNAHASNDASDAGEEQAPASPE